MEVSRRGRDEERNASEIAATRAAKFRNNLKESKGDAKVAAARELFKYASGELKDEAPRFIEEFLAELDGKTDVSGSPLYMLINSSDIEDKKCGIFMIVCLADHQSSGVVRYANYLLKTLTVGNMDEETIKMACRALAYLIQTSKSYAAELVDRSLDQCMEWLQEETPNEGRRLAAAHLSRELAIFIPTAFFLRANLFFNYIFNALRDKQATVRVAAIEALHAVLTITSQREAKQKIEWYTMCFEEAVNTEKIGDISKEDKYHSMALVLNELLRIADSNFEKTRKIATDLEKSEVSLDNPIDRLVLPRFSETVESTTARTLIKSKLPEIIKCTEKFVNLMGNSHKNSIMNAVMMQLFPRVCAFDTQKDRDQKRDQKDSWVFPESFHQLAFERAFNILSKHSSALPSIGMLMMRNPKLHRHHVQKLVSIVADAMAKKRNDENYFVFLFLLVDAYGKDVEKEIKMLLPQLMKTPLSRGLTKVLKMIMLRITDLRLDVQDGVMASVFHHLTGVVLPPKSESTPSLPPPKDILATNSPYEIERIVLSIDTLGEFYFSRGALQRIMQFVADHYLIAEQVPIRLAAVKCCCDMIEPFVAVYKKVSADRRDNLLKTIHALLRCLVSVVVVDPRVEVRMQVIKSFGKMPRTFLVHLAQPDPLETLFMALHDEKLEMQEACVTLLGRLAELNPALVFPRMRRMLLETLSQLTNSGQARLEQHSARMITLLSQQSPKFMRPYIGSLLTALMPKIRCELKYADVTVYVLNAISELGVIGGSELVRCIGSLFHKLASMITDNSSLQRREAALRAMGRICRSTAYVVDPYKDYPTLLDDLLKLLKTVMSSTMRREAIKVLGILGAIDPYTHKVFTGSVQSAYAISTALSLPASRDVSDPRQDIVQWFNYEKCTLEEFYPAITIANLMLMIQDDAYASSYREIAQALLHIFQSLGDAYPQYVGQVVPRLIEVCRNCTGRPDLREFFLRQLSLFVVIIKHHSSPYMKDIFSLIADAWKEGKEGNNLKITVVSVLEDMGTALGPEFSPYASELIPYLLHVLQTDKTRDRHLTIKVLTCIRPLSGCLTSHLHLVFPPILILLDDCSVHITTRSTALDTVLHLTRSVDVSSYAPRLMQTWHHCISTQGLQIKLMELLLDVIKQLWRRFGIYQISVEKKLRENNLERGEYYEAYRALSQTACLSRDHMNPQNNVNGSAGRRDVIQTQQGMINSASASALHSRESASLGASAHYQDVDGGVVERSFASRPVSAPRSTTEMLVVRISKQRVHYDVILRAMQVDSLSSRDEWAQWLLKMRVAFLKSGSSASLRAAAALGDQYAHLAKDLFNAAFMSVWTEIDQTKQDLLKKSLMTGLKSRHPDVIQTILNLAEFMDHSEKGPLPISYEVLGKHAEEVKAYAKALRYKELEIFERKKKIEQRMRTRNLPVQLRVDDCQAIITFANKLNVQDEAAGVVRYAEQNKMGVPTRGKWYEKLNDWEKALESYEKEKEQNGGTGEDTTIHEMRCLEALGHWNKLNEKATAYKQNCVSHNKQPEHKFLVMAARGSWAVDDWNTMKDYVHGISENTQDGAMLRAVVSLHSEEFETAMGCIDRVRDMYDSELTAMASESYERAYGAMVFVQQMAEIEEAIEFKLRPERRPRIGLLWSRRLQGCRQNVEQWQRLLMLRGLVLSPAEMHPLRVKYASLCRKQGKLSMSRAVIRDLYHIGPNDELHSAYATEDKPQLVLALCKQLWTDDMRGAAVNTLEALANHLHKIPRSQHSTEALRLCAKIYVKLGEWTDLHEASTSASPVKAPMSQHGFVGQYSSQVTSDVIQYYTRATEYDPKWHKAWHRLAQAHFYACAREREASQVIVTQREQISPRPPLTLDSIIAAAAAPNMPNLPNFSALAPLVPPPSMIPQPPPPLPPPSAPLQGPGSLSPIMTNAINPLAGLTDLYFPPSFAPPQAIQMPSHQFATPSMFTYAPNVFKKSLRPSHLLPNYINSAIAAIKCFSKALNYAPGSRLEDTLRLLQLWFEYGSTEEVFDVLSTAINELPINTWLEVVPQLMARLDVKQEPVQLVTHIVAEVSKKQPQSLVYALTVAAKSQNEDRARNARMILKNMGEYYPRLVEEASMVSEELVRCAILWHEKWHDALDEASRLYFHENNVQGMFDALRELHIMMKTGPKTLKEQSFTTTYLCDLKDANKFCQAYERSKNAKDLNQAWEIYCGVFKRLRDQLQSITSLDMNYVSPSLMRAKDLELAVPGTYDPTAPVVGIASFGPRMQVITSKQRPRKMTIRGSDGLEYTFLLKGHEDPRQDERVMQLFGLVNTLLANNSETCRSNLTIQRYSIVALSKDSGLIGWVPNCDTLHSLVKDYREKKAKISLSVEHKVLQAWWPDTEKLMVMQKLQLFDRALLASDGADLRHVLWLKSPSSEVWFDRRTNYTRSMACMSMVGYMLGLGDRHPSNLMLDRLTGKIIHIDFGDCFEVAMSREKFPERIPFRLTRMLINAMEISGIDGTYCITSERVLKVLRANRESLLAVLEAFVYDPVINWRLLEGNKRIPGEKKDYSKMNIQEAPRAVSQGVINRIKQKLTGTEFETEKPVSTTEQLDGLLTQAMDHSNLCQCYIGWCPFW